MAFKHLLHNRRIVRLGGFRLWRFHFGGGVYTVGPMSTLRFVQYLEAAGKLGAVLGETMVAGELPTRATLDTLRVLLPLMISEYVVPSHLEHASARQVVIALTAWQEVNDLPYMLKSLQKSGDSKGQGFDRFVVNLARTLHLDVRQILEKPYQEVLAIVDALNAEEADLPEGAEPVDEEKRKELRALAGRAGLQVN
jgi:hypothetical protein